MSQSRHYEHGKTGPTTHPSCGGMGGRESSLPPLTPMPEAGGRVVPEVLSFILYYFGVRRDTGGIRRHDVKVTKVKNS